MTGPLCRSCTHPQSEHREGRGGCLHVDVAGFSWGASDIMCACAWFLPPTVTIKWVIEVCIAGHWAVLDLHSWPTMEAAERFAEGEIGGPYCIRREGL